MAKKKKKFARKTRKAGRFNANQSRDLLSLLIICHVVAFFLSQFALIESDNNYRFFFLGKKVYSQKNAITDYDIKITLNNSILSFETKDDYIPPKKLRLQNPAQVAQELKVWVQSAGYKVEEWNYNLIISDRHQSYEFKQLLQALKSLGISEIAFTSLG